MFLAFSSTKLAALLIRTQHSITQTYCCLKYNVIICEMQQPQGFGMEFIKRLNNFQDFTVTRSNNFSERCLFTFNLKIYLIYTLLEFNSLSLQVTSLNQFI